MVNESADKPTGYDIVIMDQLDDRWQTWFDDLTVCRTAAGQTKLSGPIRDQAALHGVLKKINNLGLTLISVNPQPPLSN